jgi:hypothetical protein
VVGCAVTPPLAVRWVLEKLVLLVLETCVLVERGDALGEF